MELFMILVYAIIVIVVLNMSVSVVYRIVTGESANKACKSSAKAIWSANILGWEFSPLDVMCDIFASF